MHVIRVVHRAVVVMSLKLTCMCPIHTRPGQRACRSAKPLNILRLPFTGELYFVLVNPAFEAPTREMRAALPAKVPFSSMISNSVAGGSLVRSALVALAGAERTVHVAPPCGRRDRPLRTCAQNETGLSVIAP